MAASPSQQTHWLKLRVDLGLERHSGMDPELELDWRALSLLCYVMPWSHHVLPLPQPCLSSAFTQAAQWAALLCRREGVGRGVLSCILGMCLDNCKHGACSLQGQCCDDQCLGGCSEPGNASSCVACRNLQHGNTCVEKCPPGYYVFKGWRCISFSFCQELHNQCKQTKKLNQDRESSCAEYVIHNGACIPECPSGYTTINSTMYV
eukprot:superscaffoldBa00004592_g19135